MTSLHWQTSLQNRQCHALCTLGRTSKCDRVFATYRSITDLVYYRLGRDLFLFGAYIWYHFSSFSSFSCLLFLIQLTDFLCHGYFLDVSAVYFGCVTVIVFDLDLVLSQKSYYM